MENADVEKQMKEIGGDFLAQMDFLTQISEVHAI